MFQIRNLKTLKVLTVVHVYVRERTILDRIMFVIYDREKKMWGIMPSEDIYDWELVEEE